MLSARYLAVNNNTQELFFTSGSPYKIFKKKFDGTLEQEIYSSSGESIYNIEVDETNAKIYWVENQKIKRANLDGTNVETIIDVTTDVYIRSLALTGSNLYWSERFYNTTNFSNTYYLKKSSLDGSSVSTIHTEVVSFSGSPVTQGTIYDMEVDESNGHIYWASYTADAIFRKNSDGSGGVTTVLNSTYVLSPRALALDVPNNKIYWTDSDATFDNLRSSNLDGSNVILLSSAASDPYGLALATINPDPLGLPEIDVQGNSTSILNNDLTPETVDNTDFGSVPINNNYKDHYFFVRNLGGTNLTLSGSPRIIITGINAGDFTLQTDANSTIAPTSNTYFTIRFDPSVVGERMATITVNSNDSNEGAYSFNIKGTGDVSSGETGTNDIRLTTHAVASSLDNEDPSIAYDPTLNRYLLVFESEITNLEEEIFGQFIAADGSLIGSQFQISSTGPGGNTDIDGTNPKVVYNTVSNQFFVIWLGDMDASNISEYEVFGQLINPNGTLVGGLGTGQIRLSKHGTDGDDYYSVSNPELAVNTNNGDYYVVWQSQTTVTTNTGGFTFGDEVEVFGTRILSDGTIVSGLGNQTKLSNVPDPNIDDNQDASIPHIAFNSTNNQYLVVYESDKITDGDDNIFGQLINSDGSLVHSIDSPKQFTSVGASRDADNARVVYNSALNEYLVGYQSDHVLSTDNEDEIFGQRVSNLGVLVGSPIQLSFAGIDGDGEESGSYFSLDYNASFDQILATFQSEESGSNSFDIYATTLDASTYSYLESQSRVSDMGTLNGDNTYTAQKPRQAFNSTANNFLIVWEGDDQAPNGPGDNEDEIFGQLWQSPPTPEIDIEGNNLSITDGDSSPSLLDLTDFGSVNLGVPKDRVFTIKNLNSGQLVLNGSPTVSLNGINASDFEVSISPATVLSGNSSTTFQITFTPSASGSRTASLSISNNDSGENPYNFDIKGTGVNSTPPTITSVTVPASGTYISGQNLDFMINFSENITVNTIGGTPQLSLTIGATTRQAVYTSGSGTSSLLFRYTVQTGELDIDGISVGTLSANSGTLRDASSNNANLTLNSVGSTTAVLVDAVAPTITSVSSTLANGTYIASEIIPISVVFSEPVFVTGIPQLILETGLVDQSTNYSSGNGSQTLTFNYTIQTDDYNPDLDYQDSNALKLNHGSIKDISGNNTILNLPVPGALNSLGSNKEIFINGRSANADLSSLTLSFGTLSPLFNPSILSYEASVDNATNSLTVTCVSAELNASIKVNEISVSNGLPSSPIPLNIGSNTIIIVVTAHDGTTIKSYTLTVTRAGLPEINVKANSFNIISGDPTPSYTDSTNFGSVGIYDLNNSNSFIIENLGTSDLIFSGTPKVVLSGKDASSFNVVIQPSSPLSPLESTSFSINFDPATPGQKNAIVSILNNDGDESPYTFSIQGEGVCNILPVIVISGTENLDCHVSSVTRTASGGNTYSWSNGLGTSATANMNLPGIYTVTVSDINGCSSSGTTEVTVDPTPQTLGVTAYQRPSACGVNDATITFFTSLPNGTFDLNFTRNSIPLSRSINVNGSQLHLYDLEPGLYSNFIINNGSCQASSTAEVNIVPIPLNVTASNNGPYIEGQAIQLTGTGGPTYNWSGPNSFSSNFQNPSIVNATSLNGGVYTLTVSNGACTATATTLVTIDDALPAFTYYYAFGGPHPEIIAPLTQNAEFQNSDRKVTILAVPNIPIASSRLQLTGTSNLQYYEDNQAPYALHEFNNQATGDLLQNNFYSLIARGYNQINNQGSVILGPDVISFWVVGGNRTVELSPLNNINLCSNTPFNVLINTSGSFEAGNNFIVYISDESGYFTKPIQIGSGSGNSILCSIPNYINSGSLYKIKVVSTSPIVTSEISSENLTIIPSNQLLTSPNNDIINIIEDQKAIQVIEASNKVSGNSRSNYISGSNVLLKPGFEADAGTVFEAKTQSVCP
ncbi:MAG: choice-of-anchor D domain-containing protein [Cytophagales bacterium]|nr:choice-of-anchor D domain-containing protein [Cytophagales bacterium]